MLTRIGVITLGLAVAGFVVGGIVGMVMMTVLLLLDGHFEPSMLAYSGTIGGGIGAVLGPIAAWLLMRHVPLWLAMGGTALGTLAGGIAGMASESVGGTLIGGFLGFGASAVYLRLRKPRGAIAPPDGPALRG